MKPTQERDEEAMFLKATGHSSICNCVRWYRGRLVVTLYKCNCENGKAPWCSKPMPTNQQLVKAAINVLKLGVEL